MTDLSARLAALEWQASQQPRQCATCAEWPATHVVYPDLPAPSTPDRSAQCSACGWEPVTIVVRYGENQPHSPEADP
jgi:hypothetical protein